MTKRRALLTTCFLPLFACGGGGNHPDYSKCKGASGITITNGDALDGSAFALRRGVETDLGLEVGDQFGNACDPSKLSITFDDDSQIEVVDVGEHTVLKALRDAIDDGTEPTTVMHMAIDDFRVDFNVASVLDFGGDWNVTVSEHTLYPDGYPFGKIVLTQRGRQLTWEKPDCTIPQACGVALTIRDAGVTANISGINLMVDLSVSPDRKSFAGDWSTDHYAGTFSGERP